MCTVRGAASCQAYMAKLTATLARTAVRSLYRRLADAQTLHRRSHSTDALWALYSCALYCEALASGTRFTIARTVASRATTALAWPGQCSSSRSLDLEMPLLLLYIRVSTGITFMLHNIAFKISFLALHYKLVMGLPLQAQKAHITSL